MYGISNCTTVKKARTGWSEWSSTMFLMTIKVRDYQDKLEMVVMPRSAGKRWQTSGHGLFRKLLNMVKENIGAIQR